MLSPARARALMALAALAGLFASVYLLYTYVSGAPIACGLVSGCEAVRASKWAYSFGLPRPAYGVVFYVLIYAVLVVRAATPAWARRWFRVTQLAACFGFLESAVLFLIQWFDVKAFCIWCLASAAAATVVFTCAWFDSPAADAGERQAELKRLFFFLLGFVFVATLGLWWLLHATGEQSSVVQSPALPTSTSSTSALTPADVLLHSDSLTEGPASSSVLVVEFGDIQCPACRAFAPTIQRIRMEYRGRIRFAFRHFPLFEIHEHAADAARAAVCAQRQGQGLPFIDRLYADTEPLTQSRLSVDAYKQGLNRAVFQLCLLDPKTKAAVDRDRQEGMALGIRFTPTLFVNHFKIDHALPYQELKSLIEQELHSGS